MDLSELDGLAGKFFAKGLADSTQRIRTYRSAQNRYLAFCREGNLEAIPVSENVLCYYVSYLAREKLRHKTIKVYMSAVRYLHVAERGGDPFQAPMVRLQYVLRGIKRCEAEGGTRSRERLPISPDILGRIRRVWGARASDRDVKMLWAACCLGFFAFLRIGEMTVPSEEGYDPAVHLSWGDVAIDDPASPSVLRVTVKQSKTDPFRRGVDLFLGKTEKEVCPVQALLGYMVSRGCGDGPLFVYKDGRYLTRQRLVEALRGALEEAGLDCAKYCGHSFRIGAATAAAKQGIEDSIIQTLGRWKSLAYLQYVKIPRDQLANYSRVLCA